MPYNIKFDLGALKKLPTMVKIPQIIVGVICYGLVTYLSSSARSPDYERFGLPLTIVAFPEVAYFMLVTFAFLVMTTLVFVSFLFQYDQHKSFLEIVHSLLGVILYFTATISMFAFIGKYKAMLREDSEKIVYGGFVTCGVFGLLNTVLYVVNTVLAFKSIRASEQDEYSLQSVAKVKA